MRNNEQAHFPTSERLMGGWGNVGPAHVPGEANTSMGQRHLTTLSKKVEYIIGALALALKQADIARFYFQLKIQDEISPESAESLDEIYEISKKDALLFDALSSIDICVSDAITSFMEYEENDIKEEYTSLWKKEELSESDYERISFILKLARTEKAIESIVDNVDKDFLEANRHSRSEL